MKKSTAIILANVVLVSLISGCNQTTAEVKKSSTNGTNTNTNVSSTKDNVVKYKDGTFEAKYDDGTEGFYCKAKITIKDNKITNVDWSVYDSENRLFDDKYENVYDNEVYKDQCRENLKGGITYGPALVEKQDIKKVDVVTGATWVYYLFRGAVTRALENAK